MTKRVLSRVLRDLSGPLGLGSLAWMLTFSACANTAVMPGVAVGRIGQGLSTRAQTVPQAAEVCALEEALRAPTPGVEKPLSEVCKQPMQSDRLWRRSLVVLAAHADKIEAVASGAKPETAGQLEAALTGVSGSDWTEAEGAQEQAARDAAAQLVSQMGTPMPKADLGKTVQDAAPQVKTLCQGLDAFFDAGVKSLANMRTEVEKKRATHANRRCAMVDNRTICVSESVVDRMAYAMALVRVESLQTSYLGARDDVAMFCAAHRKLEEVSASGQLGKDATYGQIVEAVRSVPRVEPPQAGGRSNQETKATPSGKPATPDKK
jgi:hypothetical protein